MREAVRYDLEPRLCSEEFVDVLLRSERVERRPITEPDTIAGDVGSR
jgi:hypothetical protein